jgi:TolB-like protein/class 3 adenylate cyclase/tetratricopeptide (TPR) repeat protein
MTVTRRLAAILAADVVGYSRLMGLDEAGTLAALKARRQHVLEPLVARHRGRIFKVTGDGVLIEFGSAVNAVQCAAELQTEMAAANAGLIGDRQIVLRIGVNLGDVMFERGDLYGDGVNVAARLEGMAEPGTILVSGMTFDYVRNKTSLTFEDLGIQRLKNIAEPVRVYRVADALPIPARERDVAADKPSVAVLPFTNLSSDPDQQFFSDGITDDIITEMSRFHSLLVIARNSSFQFRIATDVKLIGRQLGVRYVVEGSVRRSAGRTRITAQLIEVESGNHVWAEHYDRDNQDLFALQDEVVHSIVATIEGRMAASGALRSRRKPTSDLAAYDCFLQGREHIERRGDLEAAHQQLRHAIELDPGFAQAHAWLSRVHIQRYHFDLDARTLHEALTLAHQAVYLDESDAWSHAALGYACTIAGQHDLAGLHLQRAIALNPLDVRITSKHAMWMTFLGRGDEAVRILESDLRRDPFPPAWYWDFLGIALFQARRYEEAVQALNRLTPAYHWDQYYLAASYAHLGLTEQSRACGVELLRARPSFALQQVKLTETFKNPADLDRLLDGLRKSGLPD